METVIEAVPAACRCPRGPGSADRKSNPDSALATPPASYGDATTGTPAYCKPVVGSPLDCRDGTSDGRCNKGASGQLA
jgi:hypothetical protein